MGRERRLGNFASFGASNGQRNDGVNRTTDNEPSDADLVERAQRGDPTASAALVVRYQDRVYNTCLRMCHNTADALDLTQGALLRALAALPRFESRANFFTWLFRIVVNHVITHRRRARPTASLNVTDEQRGVWREPAARRETSDPAMRTEREELCARLNDALARLDDDFRAAVVLKDIEDLDYAQIGEILDVPVGTVKSRIHRGRTMLRAMLAEAEETRDGRV